MTQFKIILFGMCLLIAGTVHADFWTNCTNNGGTIITANSYGDDKGGLCNNSGDSSLSKNCNGKRFCRNYQRMNWWTAFTWCESIGGKLASFESMCPTTSQIFNNTRGACPNLVGRGSDPNVWTGDGWSNYRAFVINTNAGGVDIWDRNSQANSPFCEE